MSQQQRNRLNPVAIVNRIEIGLAVMAESLPLR
jgi:hypothetical protein